MLGAVNIGTGSYDFFKAVHDTLFLALENSRRKILITECDPIKERLFIVNQTLWDRYTFEE